VPQEATETSEADDVSDELMPGLLRLFYSKVSLAAESNAIPGYSLSSSESSAPSLALIDKPVHWLAPHLLLCDPGEPGFVCAHTPVPASHSLGFWVWRPAGVNDGTLLVKAGQSVEKAKAWSSLVIKLISGFVCVAVADGNSVDGFKVLSKSQLKVDGWTHIAYVIDASRSVMKIFLNGVLSNETNLKAVATVTEVIETKHSYDNDMREYWKVSIPGARKYTVVCDPKSETENGNDYLRFYEGTGRSKTLGLEKYTGTTFPGVKK